MAKKDEYQYYEELLDSEQEQKKFKKAAISLRQAYGDECLKHNIKHLWELNYKLTEDCRIAFEKFTKCKNKIEKKFKFEFPVNCYSDDLPLGFSDYFMDNYIHKSNSEVSHIDREKLLIIVQNGESLFEISGFSDISTLEMFITFGDYVERDNEFNLVTRKKEKLQWRELKKGWKND